MNGERALSLLPLADERLPQTLKDSFTKLAQVSRINNPRESWRQPLFGICLDAAMFRETPEELVAKVLRGEIKVLG